MAQLLGRSADAAHYGKLAQEIRNAFCAKYMIRRPH